MEVVEVPQLHKHPLVPFTRFAFNRCEGCLPYTKDYIYGGYRCNELGCDNVFFHKECGNPLPELNHSSHPDHPLKLVLSEPSHCSLCREEFKVGYCCSICDFKLDLRCARRPPILEKSNAHEHPLEFFPEAQFVGTIRSNFCKVCDSLIFGHYYACHQCEFYFHLECADVSPEAEAYHISHTQHPLKLLTCEETVPDYADKDCLLCATEFNDDHRLQFHHCDVCNFSICQMCMVNSPPLHVLSLKTHEHQLSLVPRRIEFTCNACGTKGDRSPYFCLQCNFMIHRECIDLPRVININRHDHRIYYTHLLGHGNWKCRVCRVKVDGFYGAYTCSKCPDYYVVHSRCATRNDVWDMVELEGTPEEPEEPPPFEVINDNTIKHFSHDHNLTLNKNGMILSESTLCVACVFQICSEPFYYSCEQCGFILHERCANLPLKKRHVCDNQRFTLHIDSHNKFVRCCLCEQRFSGFMYRSTSRKVIDVRCGSFSEPFLHKSHQHPLYYSTDSFYKRCSECGGRGWLSCGECDFRLDFECAFLPQKVMRQRYDDHPLFLSYGENMNGDVKYWCEACETKVNPKKWFYTCNDCGVILHVSCVVGDRDLSYMMPNSRPRIYSHEKVVSNKSICRPKCHVCKIRCKYSSIIKISMGEDFDRYICSSRCLACVPDRPY